MARARAVFALWAALAAGGIAAVSAALVAVLARVDPAIPTFAEVAAACRRFVLLHVDPVSVLALGLGALSAAALALALQAGARELRATRRLRRRLHVRGPLPGAPDAWVFDADAPIAFCAGLLRPRVYVSSRACELLTAQELEAVVAHERHHARRRDPLRLLVARSISRGLFFVPSLRQLTERYAAFAELAADEAAQRATGGRSALASALLAFDEQPAVGVGISRQRADRLLGARVGWELPVLLVVAAVVVLITLTVTALRFAQATDHVAVSVPELLAQACMLAMASAPIAFAAAAAITAQRVAERRRAVGAGE